MSVSTWSPASARALRKRLGLTQAEMAEVMGYSSQSRVSEMEGREEPIGGTTARLLDYVATYGVLQSAGANQQE